MDGRASRVTSWVAVAIVLAIDAAYIALIRSQGGVATPDIYTVPFVSGYLLVMAALIALPLAPVPVPQGGRIAMRGAAAGGLLVLGVIAAFSIGVPLIVAGLLAAVAAATSARPPERFMASLFGVAAALVAVTVLIAGFEVTERVIVCPESGTVGGGGPGFLTGPYHYQCVNGRLTFTSGSCNGVAGSADSNGNVGSNGC